MARIAALDVGTKTIGVAATDPMGWFPQPIRTVSRQGVRKDTEVLLKELGALGTLEVVVGLPYELDGKEERSARLARQIGESLREQGCTIHYVDERFTSVDAERRLIAQGVSREKRKTIIDQVAAMLILETFLAERNPAAPATSDDRDEEG